MAQAMAMAYPPAVSWRWAHADLSRSAVAPLCAAGLRSEFSRRFGRTTPDGGRREPMSTFDEVLRSRQERIDEAHRLRPGQMALLVIDMQRGFLEQGSALEIPSGRAIIPNLRKLIEACRQG